MISHRHRHTMILALSLAVASFAGLSAQAADMLSGTWRLNVAKSSYSPGPSPKSLTRTYTLTADSVRTVSETVSAAGVTTHGDYTAKLDGKDYPTGAANAGGAATVAWRKISDSTFDITAKGQGQALTTSKKVIATDGKTFTDTTVGKNAEGKAVKNTLLFERQ